MANSTSEAVRSQVRTNVRTIIQGLNAKGGARNLHVRIEAAALLCGLTADIPCSRKEFAAAGGLPILASIVKSKTTTPVLLQATTRALSNLAREVDLCHQLSQLVLEPLSSLLVHPSTRKCVLVPALDALSILSSINDNVQAMHHMGATSRLLQIVAEHCSSKHGLGAGQAEDHDIMYSATRLLSRMAKLPGVLDSFLAGGICTALVQLLLHSAPKVVLAALRLVRAMVKAPTPVSTTLPALFAAGVTPALMSMATSGDLIPLVQQRLLDTLADFLNADPGSFLQAGGVGAIVGLLTAQLTVPASGTVGITSALETLLLMLRVLLAGCATSEAAAVEAMAAGVIDIIMRCHSADASSAATAGSTSIRSACAAVLFSLTEASKGAALPALISIIDSCGGDSKQDQARQRVITSVLKQVVCHSTEMASTAVSFGIIAALLSVLQSPHSCDVSRCLAVRALDMVAMKFNSVQEVQLQLSQRVPHVLQMVLENAQPKHCSLLSAAITACTNMAKASDFQSVAGQAIPPLLALLTHKDPTVIEEAITALGCLCREHEGNARILVAAGGIHMLVKLLTGQRTSHSCCFAAKIAGTISTLATHTGVKGSIVAEVSAVAQPSWQHLLPSGRHCAFPHLCTHCQEVLAAVVRTVRCLSSEATGPEVLTRCGAVAGLVEAVLIQYNGFDGQTTGAADVLMRLVQLYPPAAAVVSAEDMLQLSKLNRTPALNQPGIAPSSLVKLLQIHQRRQPLRVMSSRKGPLHRTLQWLLPFGRKMPSRPNVLHGGNSLHHVTSPLIRDLPVQTAATPAACAVSTPAARAFGHAVLDDCCLPTDTGKPLTAQPLATCRRDTLLQQPQADSVVMVGSSNPETVLARGVASLSAKATDSTSADQLPSRPVSLAVPDAATTPGVSHRNPVKSPSGSHAAPTHPVATLLIGTAAADERSRRQHVPLADATGAMSAAESPVQAAASAVSTSQLPPAVESGAIATVASTQTTSPRPGHGDKNKQKRQQRKKGRAVSSQQPVTPVSSTSQHSVQPADINKSSTATAAPVLAVKHAAILKHACSPQVDDAQLLTGSRSSVAAAIDDVPQHAPASSNTTCLNPAARLHVVGTVLPGSGSPAGNKAVEAYAGTTTASPGEGNNKKKRHQKKGRAASSLQLTTSVASSFTLKDPVHTTSQQGAGPVIAAPVCHLASQTIDVQLKPQAANASSPTVAVIAACKPRSSAVARTSESSEDAEGDAFDHCCNGNMFAVLADTARRRPQATAAAGAAAATSQQPAAHICPTPGLDSPRTTEAEDGWFCVPSKSSRRQPASAHPSNMPATLRANAANGTSSSLSLSMQQPAGCRGVADLHDAIKRFVTVGSVQESLLRGLGSAWGYQQQLHWLQGELEEVLKLVLSGSLQLADKEAAVAGLIDLQEHVERAIARAGTTQQYSAVSSAAHPMNSRGSTACPLLPGRAAQRRMTGPGQLGSQAAARKPMSLEAAPTTRRMASAAASAAAVTVSQRSKKLNRSSRESTAAAAAALQSQEQATYPVPTFAPAEASSSGNGRLADTDGYRQHTYNVFFAAETTNGQDCPAGLFDAAAEMQQTQSLWQQALDTPQTSKQKGPEECVVCLDALPIVLFFPCKHLVVCAGCAKEYVPGNGHAPQCPVCREVIEQQVSIFRLNS